MDEKPSTEEDVDEEQSSTSTPAYDIETYRHAIEDARRTWDQQLEAFNDVASKSWRITRLNGLVATIYTAAVTAAAPYLTLTIWTGGVIGIGLSFLAVSTYLAVNGQQAERVPLGQGVESFESVREHDPDEVAYLYKTLKTYEDGIRDTYEKTEQNGRTVNYARLLFLIGVGVLSTGTLLAHIL